MYPKPKKSDRLQKQKQQKDDLLEYRSHQAALAILRDNSQCVFCWFLCGETTPRDDIHHVYGRATVSPDKREHYTSLVCTCRRHHPQPIKTSGKNLDWVEAVLQMANDRPINPKFSHPTPDFD